MDCCRGTEATTLHTNFNARGVVEAIINGPLPELALGILTGQTNDGGRPKAPLLRPEVYTYLTFTHGALSNYQLTVAGALKQLATLTH